MLLAVDVGNTQTVFGLYDGDVLGERWRIAGLDSPREPPEEITLASTRQVPAGCRELKSPTHASVWTVGVKPGDHVTAGQKLVIVEFPKWNAILLR